MSNPTETTETVIYQCDWVNDDMDGCSDFGPKWCGYYGDPEEVTETHWTCANCGTVREIEMEA